MASRRLDTAPAQMTALPTPDLSVGLHLLDANRLDLAEPYLRRELAADPENARAHAALAACLAKRDAAEEAIAEAHMTVRLAPQACWAHAAAAVVALAATGDLRAAEASARAALDRHPEGVEHHAVLAEILVERGQPAAAARAARAGLALDPHSKPSLNALALALIALGDVDDAWTAVRDALVLAPESATLHGNLGCVLLLQGHPDHAIAECREALRLDPTLTPAATNLATAVRMAGHPSPLLLSSLLIARARLLGLPPRRRALLFVSFAVAGFAAPVCWVVAGLVAFYSVPIRSPGERGVTRPARPTRTARAIAILAVLAAALVSPPLLLGVEGLLVSLGGVAVAVSLVVATASTVATNTRAISLGAAGVVAVLSAAVWLGIGPQDVLLVILGCVSLAAVWLVRPFGPPRSTEAPPRVRMLPPPEVPQETPAEFCPECDRIRLTSGRFCAGCGFDHATAVVLEAVPGDG